MTSSRLGGEAGSVAEIPKVFDALLIWRWYCREIEADFQHHYNIDIADWVRGHMTSRRLIALLDGLPEESMFKRWAVRGGDWSEAQYLQARLVNEVALSRADGKGYTPQLVKSPAQTAAADDDAEYRRHRHEQTLKELHGEVETVGDHC